MKSIQAPRIRKSAFTLIEMLISMTILALISGSLLAILVQAGMTATDLRDTDQKDEELARFLTLLRQTVETLPADSTIEMIPASKSATGFSEMKISQATGAFLFGEDIGSAGELIIGLQVQDEADNKGQEGQFYELAISRDSFAPKDTDGSGMVFGAGGEDFLTPDSEGRYWLPLVSHILSASWRYWDEKNGEWLEEWTEQNLPPLMEFVIEDNYHSATVRTIFELPEHLVTGPASETTPEATGSGSAPSSTSTVSERPQETGADGEGKGGRRSGEKGRGGRPKGNFGKGGSGNNNGGNPTPDGGATTSPNP